MNKLTSILIHGHLASRASWVAAFLRQNPELWIDEAEKIFDEFLSKGWFRAIRKRRRIYYYPQYPEGRGFRVCHTEEFPLTRKLVGYMYYKTEKARKPKKTPRPFCFLIAFVVSFFPDEYSKEKMKDCVDLMESFVSSLVVAMDKGAVEKKEVYEEKEIDIDEIAYPSPPKEAERGRVNLMKYMGMGEEVERNKVYRYGLLYDKKGKIKKEWKEQYWLINIGKCEA